MTTLVGPDSAAHPEGPDSAASRRKQAAKVEARQIVDGLAGRVDTLVAVLDILGDPAEQWMAAAPPLTRNGDRFMCPHCGSVIPPHDVNEPFTGELVRVQDVAIRWSNASVSHDGSIGTDYDSGADFHGDLYLCTQCDLAVNPATGQGQ